MAKFRLKHGTAMIDGVRYNHREPNKNIAESKENLAALDPMKWERVESWEEGEGPFEENPNANRLSEETRPEPRKSVGAMPGLGATTSKVVNPQGKTIDERYGSLDKMELQELKDIAEAEEIALPKSTRHGKEKEDIVKALRAAK